jgi:uncharacterized membrane protein
MESRPKMRIALTAVDKTIEGMAIFLLILMWLAAMTYFERLPDLVPAHFSLSGKADGFRGKSSIFFLPLIATALYIGMTLINRYPHLYNYLSPVTEENAKVLYTSATKMIRVLKLIVVVVLGAVLMMVIKSALNNH